MSNGLRELAKIVGVSHTTVARALKNSMEVSESTRKKVLKAAREMNFEYVARNSHGDVVAVCVLDISSPICSGIVRGAEDLLYQKGYSAVIQSIGVRGRSVLEVVETLRNRGLKGVILQPNHKEEDMDYLLELKISGFPMVFVDCKDTRMNVNFVASDNSYGAIKLVKSLYDKGCRNIALVSQNTNDPPNSIKERIEGYYMGLKNCGLPVKSDLICSVECFDEPANPPLRDRVRISPGNKKLDMWLNRDVEVDGIVVVTNVLASSLIEYFYSYDKSFFDRCLLAEFDSPLLDVYSPYQIISAKQRLYQMGQRAAEILLGVVTKGDQSKVVQELLDVDIIESFSDQRTHAGYAEKIDMVGVQ